MTDTAYDIHIELTLKEHVTYDAFLEAIEEDITSLTDIYDTAEDSINWAKESTGNLGGSVNLGKLSQYGIGKGKPELQDCLVECLSNIHERINDMQNQKEVLNETYIVLKRVFKLVSQTLTHIEKYLKVNKEIDTVKSSLMVYSEKFKYIKDRVSDEQAHVKKYSDNMLTKRIEQLYRIESSLRLVLGQETF